MERKKVYKRVDGEIRKIAALAVRAIEIHGCPERKIPEIC